MSPDPGAREVERFGNSVAHHLGLGFDESRLSSLREVLASRSHANGLEPADYLSLLETGSSGQVRDELRQLAEALTVPETYFFRHLEQIRAFQASCLDPLGSPRALRVLSAGCASGEEPYSLAMAVLERWPEAEPAQVTILGADFNPAMLAKARAGRYSPWSLRETSESVQAQWFHAAGREWAIDRRVKSLVTFEERNLAEDAPAWPPLSFDAIFCRNVLMYLRPEKARQVVIRLTRALRSGGLLFLGHAETLRNLSQDFHLRHTHGTFYYQLRETGDRSRAPGAELATAGPAVASLSEAVGSGASWIEAIQRASDRIRTLSRSPSPPAASPGLPRRPAALDLGIVFHLIREERFADALSLLGSLPPESRSDPDVRQLTATLLVHAGRTTEARDQARELLALDELNVGAHFVLALCSEHAGEREAAIAHSRSAISLDPTFSMAHVHLGILAKRAGELELARTEFSRALDLLPGEDAARLLLFGGGFERDALLAVCRSELAGCRERP